MTSSGPATGIGGVAVVFVVDDDESVREGLKLLIASAGWEARTCASAHDFLELPRTRTPSCLVLDVAMPGLDGLELQQRLVVERPDMPIIFITGQEDVARTVRAMKAGAVEFLVKPVSGAVLLGAIESALQRSRTALENEIQLEELRARYASLSTREREVMALVVSGLLNKQVGSELGISEITVKAHRGSVMRKMAADSLPELVMISARLGIGGVRRRR
jgi:FixJ family two-component response regulator